MATCYLLWLPVVYYGYMQSVLFTCSQQWLPVVYYKRLPVVYLGYLQSTMATCSLLWLPVVYYDYAYSLPSVLPSLLYAATPLCQPSLHYNNLCAAYLCYLLSLPMLLSALLTHSCIPCLVYT